MQSQDDKISPRFGPFETTQVPQASISHSQSFANYTNPQPNYNLQPQTFAQYSHIPDQEQNQERPPDHPKPKIIAEKPKRANSRLTFKRTLSNLVDFKHPGPKAACVAFITVMAITPVMIALMVYHFGDKDVKLTSVSGGLDYIVFNLNSDPIMDITTSPSNLVCPQGAEAVKLGKWSGTGAGCNCATGLTLGLCSDKEKLILCSEVNPIDPIEMYKWEDSAICAKRAQLGVDYVKAEVCPSGYKRCSPGICMQNSQNCPITKVTIDSGSDPNLRLGATSNYLVLERLVDKTPVIDFDISPNSLPCFSNTEIPGPRGSYLLLHEGPKGCQRYGEDTDFSYQMNKDPTTQKDVFTTNSFPDSVFKLPGYSKVISETPTLLSGRYRLSVATKAECLGMDTATILQASEAAGRLNRFMTATAITAMVLHSLLFLFLFIVLISFKKRHTLKEIVMGKEVTFWAPAYIYLGFAECIVFIVMVALVRSSVSDMSKAQQYLSDLNELACFSSGAPQLVIADYDIIVNEVAARLSGFAISLMIASLISYVPFVGILSRKHHLWKMQNRKTFSY